MTVKRLGYCGELTISELESVIKEANAELKKVYDEAIPPKKVPPFSTGTARAIIEAYLRAVERKKGE